MVVMSQTRLTCPQPTRLTHAALGNLLPSGCPQLQSLDLAGSAASVTGWTRGVEVLLGQPQVRR